MSKEKHCAQAHDIDGTLLLEGLNQYEAIQAALTSSAGWGASFILQGSGLIYTMITLL